MSSRKLAIVTGASSGIGLEIAKLAAENRYSAASGARTAALTARSPAHCARAGKGRQRSWTHHASGSSRRRNAHAGHAHSTAWPTQAGSPRRQPQVTAFIGGTPASASSATVASAIGPATPTKIGRARRSERRTSCSTSRVRSRRTAMRVVFRMAIPGGWRRRV